MPLKYDWNGVQKKKSRELNNSNWKCSMEKAGNGNISNVWQKQTRRIPISLTKQHATFVTRSQKLKATSSGPSTKLSRHLELCLKSICIDRSKESAKTLLSSGEKTMTAYLCNGANDDHLYRVLNICVKMCLPISMCEHGAFTGKFQFPNLSVTHIS